MTDDTRLYPLNQLELPDPSELETDESRAILACLYRLIELHHSNWKVAIRITAVSRSTGLPFEHLPNEQGDRWIRLYCSVSEFLQYGFSSEMNKFWASWYVKKLCHKVYQSDISFRIEPIEIWYPNAPPHVLAYSDPYLIRASDTDYHGGRMFRLTKQVARFVIHSLAANPIAWGLPDGYDRRVKRAHLMELVRKLGLPELHISWLWEQVRGRNALAAATVIQNSVLSHRPDTTTGEMPELSEEMDTEWFDAPIDSAVAALCRSDDDQQRADATAALIELALQLTFKLGIRNTGGRHVKQFGIAPDFNGRITAFYSMIIPLRKEYLRRWYQRVKQAKQELPHTVPATVDAYSNIISERAGAMVRPYVRLLACSARWTVLQHTAIHFLPHLTDVGLHLVLYLMPIEGSEAVVLSCYFDPPDPQTGEQVADALVECYRGGLAPAYQRKDFIRFRLRTLKRQFFGIRANPYEPSARYSEDFLKHYELVPLAQYRYRITVSGVWQLFQSRAETLTEKLLKRLERPAVLEVPAPEEPTGELRRIELSNPYVAGAGFAIAGIAATKGGVARQFGRAWILEAERTLWELLVRHVRYPCDVLWIRWLKSLLKFGATSAYGHVLLKYCPQLKPLVALRELLAFRFGLPVRPAPSYGDVSIRYVFKSALPEFHRLDPLIPREWWGVSLVPRYSVFQDVILTQQEYYAKLASGTVEPLLHDPHALRRFRSIVEYWADPYGSDASHWTGERLPARLAPDTDYVSRLPGADIVPEELRAAISELLAFPSIYTKQRRSVT